MPRFQIQFINTAGAGFVSDPVDIDVDMPWQDVRHAPVDQVADWNGCQNAASVWNGWDWVSCEGPNARMSHRCPRCDWESS